MFTFFATIFSVKLLAENWKMIALILLVLLVFIVVLAWRRKKRRAAYLALPVIGIGNRSTHVYHRCDCPKIQSAGPLNLISFRHPNEIAKSGYQPCKYCNP